MTLLTALLIVTFIGGLYMAWNIGANDVANAFGTSVGSGSLTLAGAVLLAAVFEFAGAFLVGGKVAKTVSQSIVDIPTFMTAAPDPVLLGIGMASAAIGAALFLHIATYFGKPVSTTHAIIGAVIGFGLVQAGPGCVQWLKMGRIAASWLASPVAGGLLAYAIYRWGVRRYVLDSRHPVFMAITAMPIAIGSLVAVVVFSVFYKGLPGLAQFNRPLWQAIAISLAAGLGVGLAIHWRLYKRKWSHRVRLASRYIVVERWFGLTQIGTACYMAFAHGANDVANSIGPLATAVHIFRHPTDNPATSEIPIPVWLLALGGVGIVVGLATYGYKVMEAIGRRITEITPTRGFSAQMATATTVLVFSKLGMPISTTFVIVGAVMGVGFARGFGSIDMKVIRKIFASWLMTIPAAAGITAVIFWLLRAVWAGA